MVDWFHYLCRVIGELASGRQGDVIEHQANAHIDTRVVEQTVSEQIVINVAEARHEQAMAQQKEQHESVAQAAVAEMHRRIAEAEEVAARERQCNLESQRRIVEAENVAARERQSKLESQKKCLYNGTTTPTPKARAATVRRA